MVYFDYFIASEYTKLVSTLLDRFTEMGIDYEEPSYIGSPTTVKINNWPGHENFNGFTMDVKSNTESNNNRCLVSCDEPGKEFFMSIITDGFLSSTSDSRFLLILPVDNGKKIVAVSQDANVSDFFDIGKYEINNDSSYKLELSKCLMSGTANTSGANLWDTVSKTYITTSDKQLQWGISELDIYSSSRRISAGTIYKDGNGDKYIGIYSALAKKLSDA